MRPHSNASPCARFYSMYSSSATFHRWGYSRTECVSPPPCGAFRTSRRRDHLYATARHPRRMSAPPLILLVMSTRRRPHPQPQITRSDCFVRCSLASPPPVSTDSVCLVSVSLLGRPPPIIATFPQKLWRRRFHRQASTREWQRRTDPAFISCSAAVVQHQSALPHHRVLCRLCSS